MLCCDMLEKVRDASTHNLSGKNLEVFLTEIGVAFHRLVTFILSITAEIMFCSALLEHLRKFPVSATGGLMLAKSVA